MDQAWTIVMPMVLGLTVSCIIIIAHKYKKLAHFTIRPLTVLLATLVSFNVFYILHVAGNQTQNQLFFSALVLAAFGLAAATVSMWLIFVIPFIILYLTSLFILDVGNLLPYIAMLVGGLQYLQSLSLFVCQQLES